MSFKVGDSVCTFISKYSGARGVVRAVAGDRVKVHFEREGFTREVDYRDLYPNHIPEVNHQDPIAVTEWFQAMYQQYLKVIAGTCYENVPYRQYTGEKSRGFSPQF